MAPPRKPAGQRQNRATKDLDTLVPEVVQVPFGVVESLPAPAGSDDWSEVVAAEWGELWRSDLASRIRDTDVPAMRRLFDWRDRQVRAQRRAVALRKVAEGEPLVEGSKGQRVANPMWRAADAADAEALAIETKIVALEDRMGLSPKARLALGLTEQRGMNLAAQNAAIALALKEAMADAPDPRALEGDSSTKAG